MARRRLTIVTSIKQRVPRGERVLVALSGGKDSSTLLHALLSVRRLLDLHIEACHVDHGLRAESPADAEFVRARCMELGVPCRIFRLGRRPPKENMEAWARAERYRVFGEVMQQHGLTLLVTAHNANDVAETLLMRLLANKELTTIEESDRRRRCMRPLLGISREQIDCYVEDNKIPFVEDASNVDTTMVRNRVRKRVLPLLEREFDRSMVWILSERAQTIASDCEALQYIAMEVVEKIGQVEFKSAAWLERCAMALFPLPYAVKWRIAQALFTPILGHTVGEARSRALLLILEGKQESLSLGKGRRLLRGKNPTRLLLEGDGF